MKPAVKILLLAMLVFISVSACKKSVSNPTNSIVGEWKLVRTKAGIGPPATIWTPAAGNTSAVFKVGGAIGGTLFKDYKTYTLTDSITLTVSGAGQQNFIYRVKGDSLNLGNRACIEGCAMQFVKVK
ncbi:hypothetical protein ACVW0P_003816 [Mucilaginibacter sp. UYNi724]